MTSPQWGIGAELTASRLNLRPYCHALQSVSQNITTFGTGGWQVITLDLDLVDPYLFHSVVTNTGRIIPLYPGWYDFEGAVALAGNTTGDRAAQFRKNGAQLSGAPYGEVPAVKGTTNFGNVVPAFATVSCNGTTDYVELYAGQDAGVTLATAVGATLTRSWVRCRWVAPL